MGNARNIAFWVVLLILVMALFQLFSGNQTTMSSRSLSYSDFVERVDAGQVSKVVLDGEKIVVVGKDGNSYVTNSSRRGDWSPTTCRARPDRQGG